MDNGGTSGRDCVQNERSELDFVTLRLSPLSLAPLLSIATPGMVKDFRAKIMITVSNKLYTLVSKQWSDCIISCNDGFTCIEAYRMLFRNM